MSQGSRSRRHLPDWRFNIRKHLRRPKNLDAAWMLYGLLRLRRCEFGFSPPSVVSQLILPGRKVYAVLADNRVLKRVMQVVVRYNLRWVIIGSWWCERHVVLLQSSCNRTKMSWILLSLICLYIVFKIVPSSHLYVIMRRQNLGNVYFIENWWWCRHRLW